MNVNALRTWGIAVSGALIAGALVLAAQPTTQAAPRQAADLAQTQTGAAPLEFLIRFQGSGPIARAQARAVHGDLLEAQRLIEAQLRRQASFQGLCFGRFTVGAAEVVLRTCAAIVASERAGVQQRWLTQLRAMRGVAYVDSNATATQNRAG